MRIFSLLLLILLSNCATYSEKISGTYSQVQNGDMTLALEKINEELGVQSSRELPEKVNPDTYLLLLERATLLQSLGDYKLSSRDFVFVDQHLGWFDPQKLSAVKLGDYLYSANAEEYRAPASERMLINIENMINFLVLNNQSAAKVEARRFSILSRYFLAQNEAFRPDVLVLGNYLGGLSFEKSSDFRHAVKMYGRAWHFGYREEELQHRLIDLFRVTGGFNYTFDTRLSGLNALMMRAKNLEPLSARAYRQKYKDDVLVIVQKGRVGEKVSNAITLEEANQKSKVQYSGKVDSINVPDMQGPDAGSAVELYMGYKKTELAYHVLIGQEFQRAFLTLQPAIYSAALSRALSRNLVDEGARSIGGDNSISSLLGLTIKDALNANDSPDTRSWSTLSAVISFARVPYPSGTYRFATSSCSKKSESNTIEGDFAVVSFSKLR